MSARLSILHLFNHEEYGGLESVVTLLAAGQQQRGHEVIVAPTIPAPGARERLLDTVRGAGAEVAPLIVPGRGYLRERRLVADLCRHLRPSIVHTHNFRSDVLGGSAARRLGLPTVTTVHGFIGGDWKMWIYERLQRRAFRSFSAVVAVSRPLGEELIAGGVSRERVHVVPNAYDASQPRTPRVEARRRLGIPADAFRIGWIGRLRAEKAPDIMVEALAAAGDRELTLSMVGDGEQLGALQSLAARLAVADRITWHGAVAGAGTLAEAFDVIALTSRTEGTPIVLLEAMAAGVPVVTTAVGGVPDVVGPDEALLAPPEDAAAIARALVRVRADRALPLRMAAAARQRLERSFATEPWVARYDEVYERARQVAARGDR
jgi:glycosyltransferase involved in cell wall biosynthesis